MDEKNNKTPEEKEGSGVGMAVGMGLGASLGLLFGMTCSEMIFGQQNLLLCVTIGIALGFCLGAGFDQSKKKKSSDDDKTE